MYFPLPVHFHYRLLCVVLAVTREHKWCTPAGAQQTRSRPGAGGRQRRSLNTSEDTTTVFNGINGDLFPRSLITWSRWNARAVAPLHTECAFVDKMSTQCAHAGKKR
jgi:hypothetical protein